MKHDFAFRFAPALSCCSTLTILNKGTWAPPLADCFSSPLFTSVTFPPHHRPVFVPQRSIEAPSQTRRFGPPVGFVHRASETQSNLTADAAPEGPLFLRCWWMQGFWQQTTWSHRKMVSDREKISIFPFPLAKRPAILLQRNLPMDQ